MSASSDISRSLDGLNPSQREAVLAPADTPLLIFAGAGSGKTRVLTHRIAHFIASGIEPERILAITFTNKAAQEMQNRVLRLLDSARPARSNAVQSFGGFIGTFHALAVRMLRRDAHRLGVNQTFGIADEADALSIMKRSMKTLGARPEDIAPSAALGRIGREKNELRGPDDMRTENAQDELVRALWRAYQQTLANEQLLDFDDLLFFAVRLLREHADALAAYQARFRHLFVDEYQDTNTAQYALVRAIAQAHQSLTVVGDDYQAIYGWRGADWRNILNFKKDYPEANTVTLAENYRSTQSILDAAACVIAPVAARSHKTLNAVRAGGLPIGVTECADEADEAAYVLEEIRSLCAKTLRLSDIVILYRTNAQSRPFEERLVRSRIPYRIAGGLRFYERKEVKDILAWLRYLKNPNDFTSLTRLVATPPRGIGKTSLERIRTLGLEHAARTSEPAQKLFELTARLRANLAVPKTALSGFLKKLAREIAYRQYVREAFAPSRTWRADSSDDRWENIEELFAMASRYDADDPRQALDRFLEDIALFSHADAIDTSTPALNLMTMHLTKGLEFPAVFIAGCEEGLLPHARSLYEPEAVDEERRLSYVALTRAKDLLRLSYARTRTLHGERRATIPSRFIADIPERLIDFKSRAVFADERRDPYDENVIEWDGE